ncbi:MAG: sigma-70 family RNA polymerase sigma factor [Deltaproteobacteria bacterium]|nr:sigma-70 family RNA polymerase sigma factor [Deltaproteobacteria bacterium]
MRKLSPSSSVTQALPSDAVLVARALDGDGWAEEAIFRRYVHFVTSLSAKLLRRQSEVEDVVQDTFLQAFRDLHKLNAHARLRQWLASITVHRAQARYRRRRLWQVFGMDGGNDDERLFEQLRVEASQEIIMELRLLDQVFDKLSAEERSCWVLRKLEGYRLTEIAAITGASLATTKRRITSAHRKINTYLAQKGVSPCK